MALGLGAAAAGLPGTGCWGAAVVAAAGVLAGLLPLLG